MNPYEAPTAAPSLDPSTSPDYQFREMKIFAWLAAALISINIPYSIYIILLASGLLLPSTEYIEIIDGLFGIGFVAGIVFYCIWKYRCACNARYFYGGPLRFSPGWCVGYYFIPILFYFRPYQAMKDLYEKTYLIFGVKSPTPLLLTWWLFWIFRSFSERIATKTENSEAFFFSSGFSLISTLLALWVIFTLTRRQYEIIQDPELAAKIGTLNPYRGALPNVPGVAMQRATLPEARNPTNSPS